MSPLSSFKVRHDIKIHIWLVVTGTMDFYDFPFSWEWTNHPNWRTPSFFRGVGIPPTRFFTIRKIIMNHNHQSSLTIINHGTTLTIDGAPILTIDGTAMLNLYWLSLDRRTFSAGILRCKGAARAIDQLILQSEARMTKGRNAAKRKVERSVIFRGGVMGIIYCNILQYHSMWPPPQL